MPGLYCEAWRCIYWAADECTKNIITLDYRGQCKHRNRGVQEGKKYAIPYRQNKQTFHKKGSGL